MPWRNYIGLHVPSQTPVSIKRRYSITADILSFQRCSMQYSEFKVRKYEPALALQLFYGTIIHQVLDRAHTHFRGLIGPNVPGSLPTDQEIDGYFLEVENSLRARRISAVVQVRDQALTILKRFNTLEGPTLYHRILNTECKLQADQGNYILHGNVDVLATYEGDPNEVEIWDYKGSDRPSQGDPLYQQYVYQMQVYAELYRRRTGQTPKRAVLYFLNSLSGPSTPTTRPVNSMLEVTLDQTSINTAMQNFAATVNVIEQCRAANNWPNPNTPPPEETCNACDKRWNCLAAANLGRTYQLLYP